jgi:conjugative relaxase-like TrwC/TraI family protein
VQFSIHKLGHGRTADGRDGAAGVTAYYERTTRVDHRGVGLAVPPEDRSMGTWHALGPHAPRSLAGWRGTPEDLDHALRGEWRGQAVQNAHAPTRVLGWDLTFSADKSVSVAYAAAGPDDRARIEEAMRQAVLTTLREAAAAEVLIRRDHAGAVREPASFAVNVYTQHLSRANDPQLHCHCVLPNYGWGADGVARTLETAELYRARVAIGQIATAELAARLGALGHEVFRDADGTVRVAGVAPALEALFAKRSAQIENTLRAAFGRDAAPAASAGQREWATVLSRPQHDPHYVEDWQGQAIMAGLERDWHEAAQASVRGRERARMSVINAASPQSEAAESPSIASDSRAAALAEIVFEAAAIAVDRGGHRVARGGKPHAGEAVPALRRIVEEAAARAVGTGASARDVLDAVAQARAKDDIRTLDHGQTPLSALVTTPAMIRTEEWLVADWTALAARRRHGVELPPEALEGLSAEQQDAVRAATAASGVGLITGVAGAGKTTVFRQIRQAYEAHGYRVVGEAYSAAAAQALQHGSGIPARTIALAETVGRHLDDRTVLVLDEAGRIPSGQLARIVNGVCTADAKLILSGDWRQLPPIGAGAALSHLAMETARGAPEASADLQAIRRQTDSEVRAVAEAAATGRAAEALRVAAALGCVVVQPSTDAAVQEAAQYLADALEHGRTIGLVAYRAETHPLNAAVRGALRARGRLPENAITYRVGEWEVGLAPGDLVAFTQNRYQGLGVRNGQRAEVVAINADTREVLVRLVEAVREDRTGHVVRGGVPSRFDDGTRLHAIAEPERTVVLAGEDIKRGLIRHDYARTVDTAQGLTVDRAVVLTHYEAQRLDRQWAAVAFTRARHGLRILLSAEGAAQAEHASPTWERAHWPAERPHQQQQQRLALLDRDTVAAVLAQTERLLARDRPGSTTLGHRAAQGCAQETHQQSGPEHRDWGEHADGRLRGHRR